MDQRAARAGPGRGHGRVRVHGRGPLAGLAHRAARVRPAAAARHGRAVRPGRRRRCAPRPTGYGWAAAETDWHALISRDDVQLVDVCTPGDLHAEIAIAALDAGKHVLCEKPLANTRGRGRGHGGGGGAGRRARRSARWSASTTAASRRSPWPASWWPAAGSALIRHVRASYLQDWLADPSFPLTWRLQRERAGSGALGDLGAHIVDLAQYLTGELIAGVSAATATFVGERPLPGRGRRRAALRAGDRGRRGRVHRPAGARARWPRSRRPRFAAGRKNALRIELNGDRGSLAFDLERLNELQFHDRAEDAPTAGFRRILVDRARPSRTCPAGGRQVTCSAGSTRSPIRSGTW